MPPTIGYSLGEFTVAEWKKAGPIAPSAVRPVLTTIEKRLVLNAPDHGRHDGRKQGRSAAAGAPAVPPRPSY